MKKPIVIGFGISLVTVIGFFLWKFRDKCILCKKIKEKLPGNTIEEGQAEWKFTGGKVILTNDGKKLKLIFDKSPIYCNSPEYQAGIELLNQLSNQLKISKDLPPVCKK